MAAATFTSAGTERSPASTASAALQASLTTAYPYLAELGSGVRQRLLLSAPLLDAAPGRVLLDHGDVAPGLPLLIHGSARVLCRTGTGHHLVLEHLTPGLLCATSAGCLITGERAPSRVVVERRVRGVLLTPRLFGDALRSSPGLRAAVLKALARASIQRTTVIEQLAGARLDERLAVVLLGRGPVVRITHQRLADELGTAREVVSRILGRFARRGLVVLHRGRIEVVDSVGLAALRGCVRVDADGP